MAVKFTDLAARAKLIGTEILALVQSGASVQAELDALVNWEKTTTISTASYTISDEGIGTLEVNVGTSTITLPDLADWAGRTIKVRKTSSFSGVVTIQRAGADVITRSSLTSVELNSQGDYWEFFAGSSAWELSAGFNTTSFYSQTADGWMTQAFRDTVDSATQAGVVTINLPESFIDTNWEPTGNSGTSSTTTDITVKFVSKTVSSFNVVATANNSYVDIFATIHALGRWF